MTAGAAMHPGVLTVAPTASMESIVRAMVAHGVHAVLVRPEDPRMLGWPSRVVTDRDIVRWAVEGLPEAVRAIDAASEPAGLVLLEQSLEHAARLMAELGETHVLVADQRSRLPDGVLSSFDLAAILGGRDPGVARRVRPAPAEPARSESRLDRIAIRDVMHSGVIGAPPKASLTEVAASIVDRRVHCVAVAGIDATASGDEHLVWSVIDTMDLVRATRRWDPALTAADIARTKPVAIDEEEPLLAAAKAMAERGVGHVVAVGPSGAPTGVVSSLDIAAVCATR